MLRYDWKRKDIQEYGIFRPHAKELNKSYASICLRSIDGVADGSFRVAYNSRQTHKIKLPLEKLFNNEDLSQYDVELILRPDELVFQVDCFMYLYSFYILFLNTFSKNFFFCLN